MGKYDFFDQFEALTPGTSNAWAFDRIQEGSTVLELGCAVGFLTKHLSENKGCVVDVIEIDEAAGRSATPYARRAWLGVEGNLEQDCLLRIEKDQYDYIVALDVLEHLRDPAKVLAQARKLLKSTGVLLLSVPNIAHDAVVVDLFNAHFRYRELGLLDNTHVSFFTHERLTDMLRDQGYRLRRMDALRKGVSETEIPVEWEDLPRNIRGEFRNRSYGDVYQFLVEADLDADAPVCDELAPCHQRGSLTAALYYRQRDEGFDEERCLLHAMALGRNSMTFSIPQKAESFRLIPAQHNGCIRNLSVSVVTPAGCEAVPFTHNGCELPDGSLVFAGSDAPQVEFSVPVALEAQIQIDDELLVCDHDLLDRLEAPLQAFQGMAFLGSDWRQRWDDMEARLALALQDAQNAWAQFTDRDERCHQLMARQQELQNQRDLAQSDAQNAWAQFANRDELLGLERVKASELAEQLRLTQEDAKTAWAQFSDRDEKLHALEAHDREQEERLQAEEEKSEHLTKWLQAEEERSKHLSEQLASTTTTLHHLNSQFIVRVLKKLRIIKVVDG